MAFKRYPIEKTAKYFWYSIGVFTLAVIFDIILGIGVIDAVINFLDPKPTFVLNEPLVRPVLRARRREDVIWPSSMNDTFQDLRDAIKGDVPEKYRSIIFDFHHLDVDSNPTMGEILNISVDWKTDTYMELFHTSISQHELYPEDDWYVKRLLKKLATLPMKSGYEKSGGTQFKMIVKYRDGYRAMFKPMRNKRTQQMIQNHFYFNDYERHNAEIAAYHLDRLLGFRRAIPVVGRKINLTSEMFPMVDHKTANTFYISPAGKVCFTGRCHVFCDSFHATCGDPHMLEGSFAAFLPRYRKAKRKVWRSPWRRSYDKRRMNPWQFEENADNYCDIVRSVPPYNTGRRLLDMMDMAILDFFIGNEDRHHYETFKTFNESDTFPIHLDHGRSFGLPYHDELSIITPLKHCCNIRKSTLKTLLDFHNGEKKLSDALRDSLKNDPLDPVLWEAHLEAIDRRNVIVLEIIRNCTQRVDNK